MTATPSRRLTFDAPGRGRVYDSILETIGNTPLVRIRKITAEMGCKGEVLAKLEYFNPACSVKDRIALSMLQALEADGSIGEDSVIVEPTSGNTGIGLAPACAALGYRCILTMPDSFSIERRKLMKYLGAELVLTPKEKGIGGSIDKAMEIIAETDKAVMPLQFVNPANPEIHSKATAEEIWCDTGGKIDALVVGVGTGGTLTGIASALKGRKPDIQIFAVEPEKSPILSGGKHSPHMIQGIGAGFIPDVLDTSLIDGVMLATNDEAMDMARKLATQEGIPGGISSGAALVCAMQVAMRDEMAGKTIVTILPDFAERYVSTALFDGLDED